LYEYHVAIQEVEKHLKNPGGVAAVVVEAEEEAVVVVEEVVDVEGMGEDST
jgi:hypothetical protein